MATIRQATAADLPSIGQILTDAGLPFSDIVQSHLPDFLVVEKDAAVVGCVGIERYGNDALLRSLAVNPSRQGVGQGRHLVDAIETYARETGVKRLFLLTNSASGFFEDHGYHEIARDIAPEALRRSTQFSQLCPSTAVCMEKTLAPASRDA